MFNSVNPLAVFVLEDYASGSFGNLIRDEMEQQKVRLINILSPEDLKLRVHRERADAIVIDNDFPDIDCNQLIQEIASSLDKRQYLPIFVLINPEASEESYQQLLQFKNCRMIRKNLPKSEVISRITSALNSRLDHNELAEARESLRIHRNQFNSLIQAHLPKTNRIQYSGWKFQGRLDCRTLYGGDFYDLYPLSDSTIAIMSGDCIGSGLNALVFLSQIQGQLRGLLQYSQKPDMILGQMNKIFQELNHDFGEFLCLFLGILDCNTGELTFASAGQSGPMLMNRTTFACSNLSEAIDPPIGIDPAMAFHSKQVQIESGSRLFLCTNGLWKNPGHDGKPLGYEALCELLKTTASLDQEASLQTVFNSLQHEKEYLPKDDAALLLIDRE